MVAILGVAAVAAVALEQGSGDTSGWNFRQRMQKAIGNLLGTSVETYDAAVKTAEDRVLVQAVADGWLAQ